MLIFDCSPQEQPAVLHPTLTHLPGGMQPHTESLAHRQTHANGRMRSELEPIFLAPWPYRSQAIVIRDPVRVGGKAALCTIGAKNITYENAFDFDDVTYCITLHQINSV